MIVHVLPFTYLHTHVLFLAYIRTHVLSVTHVYTHVPFLAYVHTHFALFTFVRMRVSGSRLSMSLSVHVLVCPWHFFLSSSLPDDADMSLHDRAVRDAVEQHLANLRSVDANALQSVLVKFDTNGAKHAMIVDQVHKVRTNFDVNSAK